MNPGTDMFGTRKHTQALTILSAYSRSVAFTLDNGPTAELTEKGAAELGSTSGIPTDGSIPKRPDQRSGCLHASNT